MKNQRELKLHRRRGPVHISQSIKKPGASHSSTGGEEGNEVQMVPGNMWLLFTFLFFSFVFFSNRRKLVLQRNTSRWNVFLNSGSTWQMSYECYSEFSLKLAQREGGGWSLAAWRTAARRGYTGCLGPGDRGLPGGCTSSHRVSTGVPNWDLQFLMCLKLKTEK